MWRDDIETDCDRNGRDSHGDKLVEFVKHVKRGLATFAVVSAWMLRF